MIITAFKKKLFTIISLLLAVSLLPVYAFASSLTQSSKNLLDSSVILSIGKADAVVRTDKTVIDPANTNTAPVLQSGRTLVPVRFISESFGAVVDWDGTYATARKIDTVIKIEPGSDVITVNGLAKKLDTTAVIINGRVFLPLRAVAEALGYNVAFHDPYIIIGPNAEIETLLDHDTIAEYFADPLASAIPDPTPEPPPAPTLPPSEAHGYSNPFDADKVLNIIERDSGKISEDEYLYVLEWALAEAYLDFGFDPSKIKGKIISYDEPYTLDELFSVKDDTFIIRESRYPINNQLLQLGVAYEMYSIIERYTSARNNDKVLSGEIYNLESLIQIYGAYARSIKKYYPYHYAINSSSSRMYAQIKTITLLSKLGIKDKEMCEPYVRNYESEKVDNLDNLIQDFIDRGEAIPSGDFTQKSCDFANKYCITLYRYGDPYKQILTAGFERLENSKTYEEARDIIYALYNIPFYANFKDAPQYEELKKRAEILKDKKLSELDSLLPNDLLTLIKPSFKEFDEILEKIAGKNLPQNILNSDRDGK